MTQRRGYLHPFHDGSLYEYGVGEEIRTIVELKMCRLSYFIRSNYPAWWDRLDDVVLRDQWKETGRTDGYLQAKVKTDEADEYPDLRLFPPLTECQISYVLDELPFYASRIDHSSGCQASCFERVWESDSAIPKGTVRELCEQVNDTFLSDESLRQCNVRKTKSALNDLVPTIFDLIHPYDFPLMDDLTLRLEKDDICTRIVKARLNTFIGAIPTDFYIPKDRLASATRLGYINNLPPTRAFAHLTSLITQTVGYLIPLFEQLLTSLHRANYVLLEPRITPENYIRYKRGEDPPDEPGQGIGEGTDDEEDATMWQAWADAHLRWVQTRIVILPDLPHKRSFDAGKFNVPEENKVTLRGRKVQITVQLNQVELTPERPRFEGSPWKCHGFLQDHIVASAMIVLDESNVTEGSVELRMAVTRPLIHHDDPNSACIAYWGMRRGSKLNQHIGSIRMRPGRCIAYPNLYQHQLSPFQLSDLSRPGHRTILQLNLVDPDIPILSSTDIPPQQASWAMEALLDSLDKRLPVEIVQKIIDCAVDEGWLLRDSDRWTLRNIVEGMQKFDKDMLKRFFEQSL